MILAFPFHFLEIRKLTVENEFYINLYFRFYTVSSYYRRVKKIYIDPPYNTGNDFVYADDFADPLARYREVTQQTTKSNPETMGRFHTNWLNMMYPRLRLAANLLRDDGVIFISIDDGEVHNLRKICDEVFGEENFIADIIWEKRYTRNNDAKLMASVIDHIIFYRKSDAVEIIREPRSEKSNSNIQTRTVTQEGRGRAFYIQVNEQRNNALI